MLALLWAHLKRTTDDESDWIDSSMALKKKITLFIEKKRETFSAAMVISASQALILHMGNGGPGHCLGAFEMSQ